MSDKIFMKEEIREALTDIIKHRNAKALNWAVGYTNYALEMLDTGTAVDSYEFRIQLIYVKNNITSWRGDDAKRVREILKKAIGGL